MCFTVEAKIESLPHVVLKFYYQCRRITEGKVFNSVELVKMLTVMLYMYNVIPRATTEESYTKKCTKNIYR